MTAGPVRRFLLYGTCALLVIVFASRRWFMQWPDIPIHIHDFLDMLFPWKHLGAGVFFNSDEFRSFIPARFAGTGDYLNLRAGGFFFALFPPVYALLLHKLACHMIGFGGMYLFLRRVVPDMPRASLCCAFFALQFALLPLFYDQISFTGTAFTPVLAWALLSIALGGWNVGRALALIVCPFFTFLLHAPLFLMFFYAFFLLYRKRDGFSVAHGAQALCVCLALYLVTHYDYVLMAFGRNGFEMNRTDYLRAALNSPEDYTAAEAAGRALNMLVEGQYHVNTFQKPIMLPFCLAVFLLNCIRRVRGGTPDTVRDGRVESTARAQAAFFSAVVFSAFTYGFFSWLPVVRVKECLPLVAVIQMRFWYTNQLFWYACFAVSCIQMFLSSAALRPVPRKAVCGFLVLTAAMQFVVVEMLSRVSMPSPELSFRQFFAPEQFARVAASIPEDRKHFRIITFGMSPTVTSFNGFRGVDLYEPVFSMRHKREFRKIIAAELEKDARIKEYFDDWGARCYLFQADALDWMRNESFPRYVDIGYDHLRRMKVSYIVSSVALDTARMKDITLVSETPRLAPEESYWRTVYVYKVRVSITQPTPSADRLRPGGEEQGGLSPP